jgi:hypothetical protein
MPLALNAATLRDQRTVVGIILQGSNTPLFTTANKLLGLSPQANYADCYLVPTFMDRGVSRGQRGGSRTVVNLSFLGRSRYFSFKQLLIYPHKG